MYCVWFIELHRSEELSLVLSDTCSGWARIHFLIDVVSHATHGMLSYLPLHCSPAASDTGYSVCLHQFQLHLWEEDDINTD